MKMTNNKKLDYINQNQNGNIGEEDIIACGRRREVKILVVRLLDGLCRIQRKRLAGNHVDGITVAGRFVAVAAVLQRGCERNVVGRAVVVAEGGHAAAVDGGGGMAAGPADAGEAQEGAGSGQSLVVVFV